MALAIVNPVTGEKEEEFVEHTVSDVAGLIDQAHAAFEVLKRLPMSERSRLMRAAADLMEADSATLSPSLVREMGKPLAQA